MFLEHCVTVVLVKRLLNLLIQTKAEFRKDMDLTNLLIFNKQNCRCHILQYLVAFVVYTTKDITDSPHTAYRQELPLTPYLRRRFLNRNLIIKSEFFIYKD